MPAKNAGKKKVWDYLQVPMDAFAKIKLPGGVVGKIAMVLIALAFSAAVVAWSASNPYVALAALLVIGLSVTAISYRLIDFAEKNPETALMEGAELLVHRQIQLTATKSMPALSFTTDYAEETAAIPGVNSPQQQLPFQNPGQVKPPETEARPEGTPDA